MTCQCPECGVTKPDGFALSVHRRMMHPTAWQADQHAQREKLKDALLRKIAAQDEEADAEARRQRELPL